MKKTGVFIFVVIVCLLQINLSQAGGKAETLPSLFDSQTTKALKQFMFKFGIMVAGVELLRAKEKQIDWPSIDLTLKEMKGNLKQMQASDKTSAYKSFTDSLENELDQLSRMSAKKDPNIYEGFDKLTHTCFTCHAVHRPTDFLKPKRIENLSGT